MVETNSDLLERVDFLRLDAGRNLRGSRKSVLGQFLTPTSVARSMASMLNCQQPQVSILDAGAGVGSLFAAAVAELCCRDSRPCAIDVTAYEIDPGLAGYIPDTFRLCQAKCEQAGVRFSGVLIQADFLATVAEKLTENLFEEPTTRFTCAILNPPYRKIHSESAERLLLRKISIETTNLYTGFLATAVKLLEPGGEMVAITPRSFCNGSYFRSFRTTFLRDMALRRLHVFDSRQQTFRDDEVLQENVILHAIKGGKKEVRVFITSSCGPDDEMPLARILDYNRVVQPGDSQCFIYITPDDVGEQIAQRITALPATLADLRLSVSTGRVVDFRAREYLRPQPASDTAPLIWPSHFAHGYIAWPKEGRKPNAIVDIERVRDQLIPNEPYVLVRRFSAKEEKRRVVAAVHDPCRVPCERIGFENHLNYYHRKGGGLDLPLVGLGHK